MTEQRRLAAILVADVVGYSRLIGSDETGTLAQLQTLRTEVIEAQIAKHAGRLFKSVGDGFLIEFASAVQAVNCAVAIQKATPTLPLRIGVHVGDVVVQGDDLLGDGVNVAARIEGVAETGGIALSRQVYDQVRDRLDLSFIDKGEIELKNIVRPVQVFVVGSAKVSPKASALPLPDKPSIAVLPFQNMSGNLEQEYFADGIAEDIITNLSKFREFNIIARNSCFAYKGKRVGIAEIGRSLKSEYIVEGSVRSAGSRVRITAQLSAASSGTSLWAERFDRDLSDVFEVQDEITTRIVAVIDPAIRDAETKAALRKHPSDLRSWDHLLRGLWQLNQFKKEANAESRREFASALERDATSATAHAWLAMSHVFDAWFNWTESHAQSLEEAHRQATKAVKLDALEPVAHISTGFACFWTGRMEQAKSAADLAVSLNPSAFLGYYIGGAARNYLGQCEAAVPMHFKALDLSPNDPLVWNCLGSQAHTYFNLGRFNDAITSANQAIVLRHGYLFARVVKTAALAHSGQLAEAAASLGAIFDIAPDFSLAKLDHYPFALESQKKHLFSGLEKAGLPGHVSVAAPAAELPGLPLPNKPSIAVLPFQNMSGDPEQEFFTDGITEDIITELSRFRSLFVIARNSSFSYKGKSPDIRQVGRELGVRYVLEGSIRKSSNRIRVTGQLIDTLTGNHIWAERYDRVLEDIFAVQEEVTQAIVAAIAPQIASAEQSKAARRRPRNLSAYEIALRAWAHAGEGIDKTDQTLLNQSIREAREALEIEPGSVLALHALARAHGAGLILQMAVDREHALREAMWAAGRAIELDGTDPLGYALRGLVVLQRGQLDRYPDALADVRRAHEMNPNDTEVLRILALLEIGVGEPERAIEHGQQVLRLNPRESRSHMAYNLLALASFNAKQYAEGVGWASRALNDMSRMLQAHANLAVCLVGTGEIDKAKAVFEAGQRLGPEFFRSRLEGTSILARPEDRTRWRTFLRIAAGLEDPSAAEALR